MYNSGFILNQATFLSKALADEHENLEELERALSDEADQDSKLRNPNPRNQGYHWANATLKSSMEYSLLLMQFAFIESMVHALSDCALELNKKVNRLTDAEKSFLTENLQIYHDGKLKNTLKPCTLEQKIEYYPKILAHLCGHDFDLNKNNYWEFFKKVKQVRDSMTHPRPNFNGVVDKEALFNTAKVVYWYHDDITRLLQLCLSKDFSMRYTETLAYCILVNINKSCNQGKWAFILKERKKFESQRVYNLKKRRSTKSK